MPLYSPRACIRVQHRHIYAVLHKKQTCKTHASYQKTKTWNILQHIFWRTYHIVRSLGAGFVTYAWKAIFWFNLDTEEQKDTNAKPCFFFPAPPLQKLHAYLPYILKYSTLLGLAVKCDKLHRARVAIGKSLTDIFGLLMLTTVCMKLCFAYTQLWGTFVEGSLIWSTCKHTVIYLGNDKKWLPGFR